MAALPVRFAGDENLLAPANAVDSDGSAVADADANDLWTAPIVGPSTVSALPGPARAPRRELTLRALAVGLGIGAVLAVGNVYTGLTAGFIDGGAVTAALLSFTFFATFKRVARIPFGPFENNVAQTAAASAAVMGFVHGLMGPMPALNMMGTKTPGWALWAWGLCLAIAGIVTSVLLRRKLIVEDALPFPTGTATAELITAVHTNRGDATRRTRFLVGAALFAAALTWFRDGRLGWIPQAFYLPLSIGGISAASLTLGVASSPLMMGTGMFIGLRGTVSLLVGSLTAWIFVVPMVVKAGWTKDASYASVTGWLVWPGLGLMMAATVVPGLLQWRTVGRVLLHTLRDARDSLFNRGAAGSSGVSSERGAPAFRRRTRIGAATIMTFAGAALSWVGWRAFGFHPLLTCAALLLSIVLSAVCARAAGETDIAPVGQFGMMAQILFAGSGTSGSLLSGAVVAGNATEVAQSMWAFKAGHSLRASRRSQLIAQLIGAIVGSVVVVPAYFLIIGSYPLGSERMPAATAVSWRATASALAHGLGGLPPHALVAMGVAFALGSAITVLGRVRRCSWLPSAMGMGIAMISPASMWIAAFVGAGAVAIGRRRTAGLADGEVSALGAGFLAGESILAVSMAAWASWVG